MKNLKTLRLLVCGLALALVLVSCPDTRPALRTNLESNRSLWLTQNIKSYSFTHSSFLAPASFNYTITVSNGVFQSAIDVFTMQSVSLETVNSIRTIDAVFDKISTQIESNELATVTYNAQGIPVLTNGKPPSCYPGVADCVAGGSIIENFKILP